MSFNNIGNNNGYTGYKIQKQDEKNVNAHVKTLREHTRPIPNPKAKATEALPLQQKNVVPLPPKEPLIKNISLASSTSQETSSSNASNVPTSPSSSSSSALPPPPQPLPQKEEPDTEDYSTIYAPSDTASIISKAPALPLPQKEEPDTEDYSTIYAPRDATSIISKAPAIPPSQRPPQKEELDTEDYSTIYASNDTASIISEAPAIPPSQPLPKTKTKDTQDFRAVYAQSDTASIISEAPALPALPAQNEQRHPYLDGFIQIAAVIKHAGEFGMVHLSVDPALEDLGDIPSEDIDYQLFRLGNPVETLIATYDQEAGESRSKTSLFEKQTRELEISIQRKEETLQKMRLALKVVKKQVSSYEEVPKITPNIKEQLLRESVLPKPLEAPKLIDLIPLSPPEPLRDIEITEQEKNTIARNFAKNFSAQEQNTIETTVENLGNGSVSVEREASQAFLNAANDMGATPIVERLAQSLSQKREESTQAFRNQMAAKNNRNSLDSYDAALDSTITELSKKIDGALQLLQMADKEKTFPAKQKEVRAMIAGLHSLQRV